MSQWTRVARIDACGPGDALEVVVGEQIFALYNIDGEVFALDGVCPHQGGPLGKGRLEGSVVTCPWHGWQFDVRTGCHLMNPSLLQPRYATRVVDGWIEIESS